jgi:microcompartment protein CcmL/EutN
MTFQALGMIETIGLPAAIAAADAATKAANVQLLGYDLATGGLVTVKLRGDVGAVQAAVRAGAQVGAQVGQVVSTHVIPRPHTDLQALTAQLVRGPAVVSTPEPAAVKPRQPRQKKEVPPLVPVAEPEASVLVEETPLPVVVAQEVIVDEAGDVTFVEEVVEVEETGETLAQKIVVEAASAAAVEVCNLCADPACPRRRGQAHRLCMHWEGPGAQAPG